MVPTALLLGNSPRITCRPEILESRNSSFMLSKSPSVPTMIRSPSSTFIQSELADWGLWVKLELGERAKHTKGLNLLKDKTC